MAGKQKGKGDDRCLWPEMLRVIRELKPTWVLGENVPGIITIAGRQVCEDLEREGYDIAVFDYEAAAVGAPHRRARVFFVGHRRADDVVGDAQRDGRFAGPVYRQVAGDARTSEERQDATEQSQRASRSRDSAIMADTDRSGFQEARAKLKPTRIRRSGEGAVDNTMCSRRGRVIRREDVQVAENRHKKMEAKSVNANTDCTGCKELNPVSVAEKQGFNPWRADPTGSQWAAEPDVGRVANGISARVDRIKALGNAVVPQQVYPILAAIAAIEREATEHSAC